MELFNGEAMDGQRNIPDSDTNKKNEKRGAEIK